VRVVWSGGLRRVSILWLCRMLRVMSFVLFDCGVACFGWVCG